MLFDAKNFNGEVFDAMVRKTPNLRLNELLKSKAIVEKQEYAAQLPDQQGGHYIASIIKARIGGTALNYDGKTDITASSRGKREFGLYDDKGRYKSYKALKRRYLYDAHELVDTYELPTYLQEQVNDCKAQISM